MLRFGPLEDKYIPPTRILTGEDLSIYLATHTQYDTRLCRWGNNCRISVLSFHEKLVYVDLACHLAVKAVELTAKQHH